MSNFSETNRKPGTLQLILTKDSEEAWAPLDSMTARSASSAFELGSGARYGMQWRDTRKRWRRSSR
jgi:hypothetical protein